MAELGNGATSTPVKKQYATTEEGMMEDAKSYAKQDFKSVVDTIKKLGIAVNNEDGSTLTEEMIAKALVIVKLQQIKDARLNRVTYFD